MKFDELNQLQRFFSTMEITDEEKKKRCDLAYDLYDAIYFVFSLIRVEKEVEELNFVRSALMVEQYRDTLERQIKDALEDNKVSYEPEYVRKLVDDIISNRPVFESIKDERIKEIVEKVMSEITPDRDFNTYRETLQNRLTDAFIQNDIPLEESYVSQLVSDLIDTTNRHTDDPYYLSKERALLIAQNEANTAINYSDYVFAKDNGATHKRWIAELDDKTRPAHAEADGVIIPIDDYFLVGGDTMRYPHDYLNGSPGNLINCRCVCTYE